MMPIYEFNSDLAQKFSHALQKKDLNLSLCPQVNLRTGHSDCAEVKVSWQDSIYGNVPYARFIRIAELYDKMTPFMSWTIDEIIRCLKETQNLQTNYVLSFHCPITVLNEAFIYHLEERMDDAHLDHSSLLIEWREQDVWEKWESHKKFFHKLKDLNIKLGLKDFGLHEKSILSLGLPIDQYKMSSYYYINGGMESQIVLNILVDAIEDLNKVVVCDGIETHSHYILLKKLGIEEGLGTFFSNIRPLTGESVRDLSHYTFL